MHGPEARGRLDGLLVRALARRGRDLRPQHRGGERSDTDAARGAHAGAQLGRGERGPGGARPIRNRAINGRTIRNRAISGRTIERAPLFRETCTRLDDDAHLASQQIVRCRW
ncbi:hypothetical protein Slu03_26210 [Sediminihabitans luteus]|nr:hypothetical protein Slu03_26210 [Sediminihabitans luteus]